MTAFMQSEKKNQILIKNCSPLKKDVGSNFQFHTVFTQVPVVISITKNWEESGPSNENWSSLFYTHKNVCLKTQSIW